MTEVLSKFLRHGIHNSHHYPSTNTTSNSSHTPVNCQLFRIANIHDSPLSVLHQQPQDYIPTSSNCKQQNEKIYDTELKHFCFLLRPLHTQNSRATECRHYWTSSNTSPSIKNLVYSTPSPLLVSNYSSSVSGNREGSRCQSCECSIR